MTAEEHGLSPVISKAVSSHGWKIATLRIISADTGVVILQIYFSIDQHIMMHPYLLEPVSVRQWQVRESSLPLYEVPGSPHIIIPRYHPLHRVTHHVHIYRHVKIEPENIH